MKAAALTLRASSVSFSLSTGDNGAWRRAGVRYGGVYDAVVFELLSGERVRSNMGNLIRAGDAGLWVEVHW